jgi:hypothetical protein
MRKLYAIIVLVALTAFGGTNTVTVRLETTDLQSSQVKFLRAYFGMTNLTLAQFSTNVFELHFKPQAQAILDARKTRIIQAAYAADDDLFNALENVLSLPKLTNSDNVVIQP